MINPKSILITGASSGIGEALALLYAAPGVTLCLSGRDRDRLHAVTEACLKKGASVYETVIDVTDRKAMEEWVVGCDDVSPLDLVIANAGISGGTGGAKKGEWITAERKIFSVNVDGVLNTVLPLIPRMIERKKGQVALMSSLASFSGWPGAPAYSASKAAVRFYGEALRGALARHGIAVNVICPGFIETRMTAVNDYDMPFMMQAGKAAEIIRKKLEQNRARIAFPFRTFLASGFMGLLPPPASLAILSRLPPKPVLSGQGPE